MCGVTSSPRRSLGSPACGGRLGVQHVERGRPDPPGPQRLDDRAGVDQAAARGVDQHGAGLHGGQFRGADQAPRARRELGVGDTTSHLLSRSGSASSGGRPGPGWRKGSCATTPQPSAVR